MYFDRRQVCTILLKILSCVTRGNFVVTRPLSSKDRGNNVVKLLIHFDDKPKVFLFSENIVYYYYLVDAFATHH